MTTFRPRLSRAGVTTSSVDSGSHRVVVGTDSSFWGLAALSWASGHARLAGADLDVCAPTVDAALGRRITEIRRATPTRTTPVLSDIDPVTTLICESRHAGLVVVGCRGRGHQGLGVGAMVSTVARSSICDVVVVGGSLDAVRGGHRRISVLLDGTAVPESVRSAAWFARLRGTGLHLLWHQPAEVEPAGSPTLGSATELAHRLAPRTPIRADVVRGAPNEAVAALTDTDVLVVGVAGPLDPLARAALYHARCPVLLVRSRETVVLPEPRPVALPR